MSNDRIPMSKEGYDKLKTQLDKMKHEDMPRIAEQIAQARGYGDLSENAEFDAAVEAQGMLQARINELQDKLARAMIVDRIGMIDRHQQLAVAPVDGAAIDVDDVQYLLAVDQFLESLLVHLRFLSMVRAPAILRPFPSVPI